MDTIAVVLEGPQRLGLSRVQLSPPGEEDVVVNVEWSGISTGTERLLYEGCMPPFPGMGYPLVPGYESVGRIAAVGTNAPRRVGERVFVPGARCFGSVRGLFGGAAAQVVVPSARATQIEEHLGERGVLLALAATAYHAMRGVGSVQPELIVGHGVLGRLLARLCVLEGGRPVVWEHNAARRAGHADAYQVIDPAQDERRDYRSIYDVSGDAALLDSLIGRIARGGEIVLAGFYRQPLTFTFPPAFMKEARLRVAAEWKQDDLDAVRTLAASGRLDLDNLITHRREAREAPAAYHTAFGDPDCLKMILDWRAAV